MPRLFIAILTFAVVLIALAFGGCTGGTTTLRGNVSDSFDTYHAVSGVLVMAIPQDGSATVSNVSDDNGNYTLKLTPNVRYNISGVYYDAYGQYAMFVIRFSNGDMCNDVKLTPGETIWTYTQVMGLHPPMSFYMVHNPVNGSMEFAPSTPVSVSGRVYFDGKAISGADVEAISAYGLNNTSTITDDNGAYRLGLDSRTQYGITATYHEMRHTIWPVFIEDNGTGIYDINLTDKPSTVMVGFVPDNEPWLRQPGAVTIEATPTGGGTPINATIGSDYDFTLDLNPSTYYDISGKFRGLDGKYYNITFVYQTGIVFSGFMSRPNETALAYYMVPEYNTTVF